MAWYAQSSGDDSSVGWNSDPGGSGDTLYWPPSAETELDANGQTVNRTITAPQATLINSGAVGGWSINAGVHQNAFWVGNGSVNCTATLLGDTTLAGGSGITAGSTISCGSSSYVRAAGALTINGTLDAGPGGLSVKRSGWLIVGSGATWPGRVDGEWIPDPDYPAEADVRNTVQYANGWRVGTYNPMAAATWPPISSVLLTADPFGPTGDDYEGTFDEAARNTDPGEDKVLTGTSYKIANVSKSGTFDESARNTDPGVAKVEKDTEYKIGGLEKVGTLVASGGGVSTITVVGIGFD